MALRAQSRGVTTAEIDHQRCGIFELVEPLRDFVRIQRTAGKRCPEAGGIDDLGTDRQQVPSTHPAIKSARQRLQVRRRSAPPSAPSATHETARCARSPWRSGAPSAASSASTMAGASCDKLLVGGARQHEHAGVANGDHVGGARDVGEEADLADQFAGAKFGDRFEITGLAYRERAMQHQEQRVRGRVLAQRAFPRAPDPGGPWR